MKTPLAALLASIALMTTLTYAREFVLTDTSGVHAENWAITNTDLGIPSKTPFSVKKKTLHGGRQEGVDIVELDNGVMTLTVIPTRGMNIYKVTRGDIVLGWNSPVKEIVNPAYMELQSRAGLGWLDGFNEFLVRCGVEWAGHPGMDDGKLLSLHGRVGNIPASKVVVSIDDQPPYRIRIRGEIVEQTFKFADYDLWTELSTEPGTSSFRVSDTLTNRSDYEREYQIIYHGNFGPPLLEQGSKFVAPVKKVTPFDDYAAKDIANWTAYRAPTKNFGEHVFEVELFTRHDGTTTAMLKNSNGDKGVRIDYDAIALPYLSLWKNTDTLKEGYATGLEPGTGFPNPRNVERAHGRVPKISPGASQNFRLTYSVLFDKSGVEAAARDIANIQGSEKTAVNAEPEK